MTKNRQQWGTRLGIILAVAGSAVGLGNFLRFPSQVAQNGGGAFMIPYFVALVLLGIPLMWMEWTAGRFGGGFGHSSAPGIFHSMRTKNRFIKYFGVAGILGPFIIYIYYVYIESWCLAYAWYSLSGALNLNSAGDYVTFLQGHQGVGGGDYFAGSAIALIFFMITFATNIWVTYNGIKGGIEKICNIAMPILFLLGIVLAIHVLTMDPPAGAPADQTSANGLGFLWNPDFQSLANPKVWLAAAGQIFFTLSLGMGVIISYASYLKKQDDVALSGLTAASTNEFAEVVLGGSIVIPAAFVFFGTASIATVASSGTFNLGFVTMPQIFAGAPGGEIYGFFWFFMLFLAGITSSISLAQPAVGFMEDEFNISRKKAVTIFAVVSFLLCQPAIWLLSKGVLDDLDFWGGTVLIVAGAAFEAVFLAWVVGIDRIWHEMHQGSLIRVPHIFKFVMKYITPTILIVMFTWWLVEEWWNVITMEGVPDENKPWVLGIRIVLVVLAVILVIAVKIAWRGRSMKTYVPEER